MVLQCLWRSRLTEKHVLRFLLVSSHTQQAAVARAFATQGGPAAENDDSDAITANELLEDLYDKQGIFDAAALSAPLRVHQLIGDPRTGIADDTTTAPFGDDISVEHLWSAPDADLDWFRYSLAGDRLPFMYMDSRLSDHSKNMMYMLRCKDPQRWTIPALAAKFRIRRQRVMAILALKEIQAHSIARGRAMPPPLHHFVFRLPLSELHLQPDGQPVDLLDLVQQQQALQQTGTQQRGPAVASSVDPLAAAEGLGSLEDFIASEGDEVSAAAAAGVAGPSSSAAAAGQQADLAVLLPQVAMTAQQLQVQLLQLLQRHHYSVQHLQQQLLQHIDMAEAYYTAHVAGTPLEAMLLQAHKKQGAATTAAPHQQQQQQQQPAAEAIGEDTPAVQLPAWLDFKQQRQHVQQLMDALRPLLASAGPPAEAQAGRLLVQLETALQQHIAAAAAAGGLPGEGAAEGAAAPDEQQQQQQQGALLELVESSDASVLAAAFNKLDVPRRQQLLDAVPLIRIKLNVQGVDLRAAVSTSSSSTPDGSDHSSNSSSSSSSSASAEWPGQVPPLVDVWGYEEVPRGQLEGLQQQLPAVTGLLQQLPVLPGASSRTSSGADLSAADVTAVQQAVMVYSGLLQEYDQALAQQAAGAARDESGLRLPPAAQRRLVRLLRELDVNAPDKLLLWESYFKELAADADGRQQQRVQRLKERVRAAIKALDQQAAASGFHLPSEDYPDLPDSVPPERRVEKDLMAALLDATLVGRQFHRGSGDRHYVSVPTYPKFEGMPLQEFDTMRESEVSIINRLAAERQDNLMWREFRLRLLRNMGLLGPDLHQHPGIVRPPKPAAGWSWVVHPVAGSAKALSRQQLQQQKEQQWLDDDLQAEAQPSSWAPIPPPVDPARGVAPQTAYVAEADGTIRGLNEGEALVVGDTKPKPRRRWFASKR